MIEYHKSLIESFRKKTGISNYSVFWISFVKGLLLGLLIYHFFIV